MVLVRANGAVQVAAGTLWAFGKLPRLAALVLARITGANAGHAFWNEVDDEDRARQQFKLLKNLAVLGGLLTVAVSRGYQDKVGSGAIAAIETQDSNSPGPDP